MLTKPEFASFRLETEKALQQLSEKYNINITAGKIRYDDNSFNLDLKMTKKEVNGESFEKVEFEKYCFLYGFKPEDYLKKFISNCKTYTIVGLSRETLRCQLLQFLRMERGINLMKKLLRGC